MNTRKNLSPELAALQERLGTAPLTLPSPPPPGGEGRVTGQKYWRSLEELADTPAFQELMRREFPEQASVWPDSLSRRQFLTLMGASLALAGLTGCSVRPAASVNMAPYVRAPEEIIPGKPLFFATAMTLGGTAVGLLVESHLGRPTKIEGNPDHPASLGATDLFNQASVLTFYDPDRSQTVTHLGQTRTWDEALQAIRTAFRTAMEEQKKKQKEWRGAGLRLLTETIVSPTLGQQLHELLEAFPEAKWHQYEPLHRDMAFRGAQLAFGRAVNTYYDFTKADVVLSLDADFLTCGPGNLRYVADFMSRRRVRTSERDARSATMNRLYVVETTVSSTGAKADHRLALRAQDIEGFARAVAAKMGLPAGAGQSPIAAAHEKWIAAVAKDLQQHRGRCAVLAGDRQPPVVHLLAHALNDRLGNVGQTVLYTDPIEANPVDQTESLHELIKAMNAGQVEMLVILGGNPVFTAPADFHFKESMQKVPFRIHLSLFQDETSRQCHWHLPETHYLESWSDTRAFEGTASIVQPLIAPLYQGKSAHELLAVLTKQQQLPGFEIVRAYWRQYWESHHRAGGVNPPASNQPGQAGSRNAVISSDFDQFWQTTVHDGVLANSNTDFRPKPIPLKPGWEKQLQAANASKAQQTGPAEGSYELVFQADPTIYDGRFANNGWLQELPKPITKITWDNAAIMSPATAKELGLGLGGYGHGGEHGSYHMPVVELQLEPDAPAGEEASPAGASDSSRKVRAPIWIMPGHADHSITVYLGYGREYAGRVGGTAEQTVGFNAYPLRTSAHPWFASGLRIVKTGESYTIACTQEHQLMENREPVRAGTLEEYKKNPRFAFEREKEQLHEEREPSRKAVTLYPPFDYSPPKPKWGMVIDLTTCTGCKACVVACQAENNIPVVGKGQVAFGREMHWLRIDRYIGGPYEKPKEFHFQPVPCMHCENAPCEYVCPVDATLHNAEGLNDMIYNRCVGTRFCSNNCPYKVRRFNFFHYADYVTPSVRQQYNPDVTVRSRGVMEKCTYCVQRIRHAEIDAQNENQGKGRPLVDGEILTACQAACPAQAIVFGDINDPKSVVKQWKDSPLNYGLLADLNTEPRTTYLAALRNPNPDLEAE
jgi:MoCo/4Fe-4S cofactor protein with predicted Tat translocation signal